MDQAEFAVGEIRNAIIKSDRTGGRSIVIPRDLAALAAEELDAAANQLHSLEYGEDYERMLIDPIVAQIDIENAISDVFDHEVAACLAEDFRVKLQKHILAAVLKALDLA